MTLVVEPHPDDAFLSVGWHLEHVWADVPRTVLTVYHDARRGREGAAYAAAVGADWVGLGLPESKMDSRGVVRRVAELEAWLRENGGRFDTVVFPAGIQHPDHRRVAATAPPDALTYLDVPYLCKQKNADVLAGKAAGLTVESLVFPPVKKWRHAAVFKSQAKFFHFNAGLKTAAVCEAVLRGG